jgi:RNA 2',3'-cyclic 3'-phosphodiesterase
MEQHTHYFYALELPSAIKNHFDDTIEKLQEGLPFKSWVHPQDLHITLAFLGNADAAKLKASNELVQSEVSKIASFELEIDHLGIFGRKDSPRIFWAGLKDSTRLAETRNHVFSACHKAGFKLETRPFSPHITLARKWTGEWPFTYQSIEEFNPFKNEHLVFHADRVVLYKTHLGKSPKYEPINIFPLASHLIR